MIVVHALPVVVLPAIAMSVIVLGLCSTVVGSGSTMTMMRKKLARMGDALVEYWSTMTTMRRELVALKGDALVENDWTAGVVWFRASQQMAPVACLSNSNSNRRGRPKFVRLGMVGMIAVIVGCLRWGRGM